MPDEATRSHAQEVQTEVEFEQAQPTIWRGRGLRDGAAHPSASPGNRHLSDRAAGRLGVCKIAPVNCIVRGLALSFGDLICLCLHQKTEFRIPMTSARHPSCPVGTDAERRLLYAITLLEHGEISMRLAISLCRAGSNTLTSTRIGRPDRLAKICHP
jgi:hypothetical protein